MVEIDAPLVVCGSCSSGLARSKWCHARRCTPQLRLLRRDGAIVSDDDVPHSTIDLDLTKP